MALSANADYTTQNVNNVLAKAYVVANAAVVYDGALMMANGAEAAPFDGTQTATILGFHFGDTVTGTSTDPRPNAQVTPGGIAIMRLAVTGVTGASDTGAVVYATDDNTFTLSDPTNGKVVGHIAQFRSAGVADVQFVAMPI